MINFICCFLVCCAHIGYRYFGRFSNYDTSLKVDPLAQFLLGCLLKEGIYPLETMSLELVLGPAGMSVRI